MSTDAGRQLTVAGLEVAFGGQAPLVRGVSFGVRPGEAYGLVGESGSGKTLTCRAVLGLLPPGAKAAGSIRLGDLSLLDLSRKQLQQLRGSGVSMVFQDPMSSLNPVLRVGDAIAQVLRSHQRIGRRQAQVRAVEMMERVGIRDAGQRRRSYPHEFSGGMRQRILIAMALASKPSLLLADEPTTALDVIVQAEILSLIDRLRREESMSLLLVSHDISIVAGMCDHVGVMYAGRLVEEGPTEEVLFRPAHPYTRALIASLPESSSSGALPSIPGSPPEPGTVPDSCAFAPRCAFATEACEAAPIPLTTVRSGHLARCIHLDRAAMAPRSDGAPKERDVV